MTLGGFPRLCPPDQDRAKGVAVRRQKTLASLVRAENHPGYERVAPLVPTLSPKPSTHVTSPHGEEESGAQVRRSGC